MFTRALSDTTTLFQKHGETHPAVLGFIVLSGYCIHRNGFRWGELDVGAYGIRRFFRIWPVYGLAVIVGVLLFEHGRHVDPGTASTLTGTAGLAVGGLVAKLTTVTAVVPGLHAQSFEGNAPLTTVAAEMWLYVFYAAAVVLALRHGREWQVWAVVALVWAVGVAWVSAHPGEAGWWHNGSLPGFLAAWWLGAKFTDPEFPLRRISWLLPVAAGWLALTLTLGPGGLSWFAAIEVRKLLLAALIGALVAAVDGPRSRVLEAGGAVGKAGYSIYAFHAPILVALLIAGWKWPLVALAAIAAGVVMFTVYERPLMRYGAALARRRSASRPPAPARVTHPARGGADQA